MLLVANSGLEGLENSVQPEKCSLFIVISFCS